MIMIPRELGQSHQHLAETKLWAVEMQVYGMNETPTGTPDAIHGQRAAVGAPALPHAKAAQVSPPISL